MTLTYVCRLWQSKVSVYGYVWGEPTYHHQQNSPIYDECQILSAKVIAVPWKLANPDNTYDTTQNLYASFNLGYLYHELQTTTAIVDTVIVESTAIVEQKPLTTQFYLLLVESPL